MSLYITSLNTGSNGNCFYIGNDNEAVLIDAGLSCRETEARLHRLGLSIHKVKAIFITHEHSDHIKGLSTLGSKHRLQIYITPKTEAKCRFLLPRHLVQTFTEHVPIHIGGLTITGFTKFHDAIDPHSFIVSNDEVKVGVFTDIGDHCDNLKNYFNQCHAVFLEANYDEEMLNNGSYPYFLKNRIRSGRGHLSNKQALALFLNHKSTFLSHLFLAHLSQHNNCPILVENIFNEVSTDTEIIVASRLQETAVYQITSPTA